MRRPFISGMIPGRAARAALALVALGCVDKRLTSDFSARPAILRLSLMSASADTRSVKVNVRYDRTGGERVSLTEQLFDVTTGSAPQVAVSIDLSACLGDAAHAGGSGACMLRAAIALRSGGGVLLDSVEVGPVSAAPGSAPAPASVSLAVVTTIGITGVPPAGLKVGDQVPLTAKLNDASGNAIAGRSVTWSSSNPAVATIDGSGRITATGAGSTNVTAQTGTASVSVAVLVRALRVDFVRITPMQILARYGVPQQLTARAVGDSGVVSTIAWQTFDDSLVSVDAQGVLRILKDDDNSFTPVCATATVTATGAKTIGCAFIRIGSPAAGTLRLPNGSLVNVPSPIVDSALAITNIVDAVTKFPVDLAMLDSGRTIAVESYRVAGAASGGTFALKSSDTTIIAPNPDGFTMRVKRRSTSPVLLCAFASALPGKETCLTVVVQGAAPLRIEAFPTYAHGMARDSGQLMLNISAPAGVSQQVTYRSSDPAKVSVSGTGLVHLLQPTTGTTVCATAAADTTRVACVTIVLEPRVYGVALTPYHDAAFTKPVGQRSIVAGGTIYLKGAALGDAGADTRVRWSSSDSTLLRVNAATGVLQAGTTPGVEGYVCVWSLADWSLALCMGTYVRPPSVTTVAINPLRTTMFVGESKDVAAFWSEDNPANATATWSSGDATAVSVVSTGLNIARVTALRASPGVAVCASISKPGAPTYRDCGTVRVSSTALTNAPLDTTVTLSFIGDLGMNSVAAELGGVVTGYQLTAGWSLRNSTQPTPTITASTSDATAATVGPSTIVGSTFSGSFSVNPLRFGTFPLICASVVGAPTKRVCATLSITGDANVRLRVAPSFADLLVGQTVSLVASVDALRGEASTVTWVSADPSRVTVSVTGQVTAVSPTAGVLVCAIPTANTNRRACATIAVAAVAIPATPNSPGPGSTTGPGPVQSSSTVTLSWGATAARAALRASAVASASASSYTLIVRDVSTGSAVVNASNITATSYTVTLSPGRQYRWAVAACNAAGCSAFSQDLFFQTPAAVPAVPSGLSPGSSTSPGPLISGNPVGLFWNSVSGAASYSVEVRDASSGTLVTSASETTTSHSFTLSSGFYKWSVAACNASGCSAFASFVFFQH